MTKEIQLHQALHGYADGHQLLASSIGLTRDQEAQLLVMSDLPGRSFQKGFEKYLTMYPLQDGRSYCIARSWYAFEMSRPGCVWTHSLLIADQDLAQLDDVRSILEIFRRPSASESANEISDLKAYTAPVGLPQLHKRDWNIDFGVSAAVMQQLYASSANVVLTSLTAARYEESVLAIFSQQWPRLRRAFKFCSGAISVRESAFDVSISPPDAVRGLSDQVAVVAGAEFEAKDRLPNEEAWLAVALGDLGDLETAKPLRHFLWRYGPDFAEGRGAFRALCEIYLSTLPTSVNGDRTAIEAQDFQSRSDRAIAAIYHHFPRPEASARLKADLFGDNRQLGVEEPEELIIRTLVSNPASDAIGDEVANLAARGRELALRTPEDANRIAELAYRIGSEKAQQYLDGYISGIIDGERSLDDVPMEILTRILDHRPSLLANPETWRRTAAQQVTLSAHFTHNLPEGISPKLIVDALLKAKAWHALEVACDRYSPEAFHAIFNWLEVQSGDKIVVPKDLMRILEARALRICRDISFANLGPRSLKVMSGLVDPRASAIRRRDVENWHDVGLNRFYLAESGYELRSRLFFLAIGLSAGSPILTALGFSHVYEAAKHSSLSDAEWESISPFLSWYWPSWDRCARLIHTTTDAFVGNKWPYEYFLVAFSTAEQFSRALSDANRTWSGERYVKGLRDAVSANTLDAGSHHHEIIDRLKLEEDYSRE